MNIYVNSAVLHTLGALNLSFNPIIMLLKTLHYDTQVSNISMFLYKNFQAKIK